MELAEFEQEVDNIIQRYGIKADSPFKASRPPTQMSTDEIHDYLKGSDRFAKSEQRPPPKQERPESILSTLKENEGTKTKSIAKAMRALQDRIKAVETEKIHLAAQLKDVEERFSAERNKWQSRVMDEINQSSVKEKTILSRFSDVETENTTLNEKCALQQEQLKILESQVKILQNENRHLTETYDIDRGNWSMQLEYIEKELGIKKEAEKQYQKELRTMETQLNESREELRQVKLSFDKLSSESSFLRKNAEQQRFSLEKNFEQIEATYSKQNQENVQRIKQLELQVRKMKEQVKSAEKNVEYWKKESQTNLTIEQKPAKVKRALSSQSKTTDLESSAKKKPRKLKKSTSKSKLNETASAASIPQYTSHQTSQYTSLPTSLYPTSLPPHAYSLPPTTSTLTDRPKTVKFEETVDSQSEIRTLEQEISTLNRNYKQLLKETSEDASDLSTLRVELNSIAEQMEVKTSRLYNLKREQQALLKSRMSSM
mmetsp:Transcript_33024/g.58147  ORF Transcript_33024/g.58147 Transcript_33024/m.58147 type:complete len:487 (+) Transcript_33024:852-2312(+)